MQKNTEDAESKKTLRFFIGVLLIQFAISICIGVITNTMLLGVCVSLAIILLPIYLVLTQTKLTITRHAIAIATQLMASLHIQQTMGMTEMHFQVFVLLAFLSFLRDSSVIISATLVVAIHHILGFISQHMSFGIVVFEDAQPAFILLLIHATFAVLECVVLSVFVHKVQQKYEVSLLLDNTIKKIMATDGSIDLSKANIPNHPQLQQMTNLLNGVRSLALQSSQVGSGLLALVEKVKGSSDALDSAVDEQNTHVTTIAESMRNMTSSISDVAELSQSTTTIADSAKTNTLNTRVSIESSQKNIAQLKSLLQTTSSAISDLSAKCENISTVMQSIKSVAEQTNLLALNAAIESARAGEHGRGFAVVADEVRNLAIKSKKSAEEIESITSVLTHSANHSVDNMNECVSMVALAVESSETATLNMKEVFTSFEQVNQNVNNVANSATKQASVTVSISESTTHLNTLFGCERAQVSALQQDLTHLNQLADKFSEQLNLFVFD